ncbi:beta-N-acetylglucosaminidase domain-containing protein [Devosia sp.]|uniref:beta-N-acetylglucosaminidase domain-containing protein n=1 Tax=Devosia sp. TaxID=1871048 RepID=UPI001AC42E6C|nr:beta-N-acetylglucosaminidase domain-containing protein [Devosia sp.]MBN9308980.1 beta-N-acetylglucosaminidase domain-containing protein [Devosia sp.]
MGTVHQLPLMSASPPGLSGWSLDILLDQPDRGRGGTTPVLPFLTGVIEGFYGRAWTHAQRVEMLDWIAAAGMNSFVYGPKDDIKIRARWREPYNAAEAAQLRELVEEARARKLNFMVAIAPCLDVVYSDASDFAALQRRLDQLLDLGVRHFALLFDDVPPTMMRADERAFPSFAAAQCHFANAALDHLKSRAQDVAMLFCPTEYCAAFAGRDVPASAYLRTLGAELDPEIGVFWTGPDIVSEAIDAEGLRELAAVIGRKPVIWENFHANDYDIRRVHAGPLGGRSAEILDLVDGFITNPNNEFEANYVPVRTTGLFANGEGDEGAAFATALEAWQPRFRLAFAEAGETLTREEIRLLGELFYQPFRCGPEVEEVLQTARRLLGEQRPDVRDHRWQAGHDALVEFRDRIRDLFSRMTELENRDLFYAFHPYLWEAREEITHLVTYLDWLAGDPPAGTEFPHRDRIYNFYRQGFTVAVQELLPRDASGRYRHGR